MDKVQPNSNFEPLPTDINSLIDLQIKIVTSSHINLNVDCDFRIETDYDYSIGRIKIVAQDLIEAVSNLIDNACDAVWEKSQELKELGELENSGESEDLEDLEELLVEEVEEIDLRKIDLRELDESQRIELMEKELEKIYQEDKGWKPKVIVKTKKYDERVEITVEDNGRGLSKELLEEDKLFVAFYTTKQAGKGTGLGLVTARDLIVKNHGELFYAPESEYTKFVIRLPLES